MNNKNIQEQIKEILENKYGYLTEDHPFQGEAIEELSNLLKQQREEVIQECLDVVGRHLHDTRKLQIGEGILHYQMIYDAIVDETNFLKQEEDK